MPSIFFSYSHADEQMRDELEKHLTMLKRQGLVDTWHDRRLRAGDEVDKGISENLEKADLILLLVSSDFLASEYCYSNEMLRAVERHNRGEARVIPVILRPCDWHSAPFGKLLAAPTDGKPVTKWANRDEGWLDVVKAVRNALPAVSASAVRVPVSQAVLASPQSMSPRSSNLRVRKEFSDADKDRFLKRSFEYAAKFFETSLQELHERNASIEVDFTRIDARQFSASAYRNGKKISQCRIRLNSGAMFGAGITFSFDDSDHGNSYNEMVSVGADDQSLFLTPIGMFRAASNAHLSEEGAAELFWTMFMERMQ